MYSVIIVDDEIWVAKGLAEIVDWESKGYEIKAICGDPAEAMDIIRAEKPDVVFTDIRMYSMNGIEMIEILQREGIKCEYVLISAYQDFVYAKHGIELSVIDYIVKPFVEEEINACAEKLTQRLQKKGGGLIFPVNSEAFYESEGAALFTRNAMSQPFFRIVITGDGSPPEGVEHAVRMQIEGGVTAWFCPLASAGQNCESFAQPGAGVAHHHANSLRKGVKEAFYSKFCGFCYSPNETAAAIQFYLCENLSRQLPVGQIARDFNFSTNYLCTLFKRYTRHTIVHFQHRVRVNYAVHLIKTTNDKLRDIAMAVGFDDYSYFSKLFKTLTGQSPEGCR